MMGIPYFMFLIHYRGKPSHIQIAAERERFLDPTQHTSTDILHIEILADVGKTIDAVVGGGIEGHFVPAPGKSLSQAHALPLTAAFDQQLVNDECDVH
jgi:hypothetical protein